MNRHPDWIRLTREIKKFDFAEEKRRDNDLLITPFVIHLIDSRSSSALGMVLPPYWTVKLFISDTFWLQFVIDGIVHVLVIGLQSKIFQKMID